MTLNTVTSFREEKEEEKKTERKGEGERMRKANIKARQQKRGPK